MDPIVIAALTTGAFALAGSAVVALTARKSEGDKLKAQQATASIQALDTQMAAWVPLVEQQRRTIDWQAGIIAAQQAELDRYRKEPSA